MSCTDHNTPTGTRILSCNELGLCQRQFGKPPCIGCTVENDEPLRLAPGVLEGYRVPHLGTAAQRRELVRWLVPALLFTGVVGMAGLAVGLIAGALQ